MSKDAQVDITCMPPTTHHSRASKTCQDLWTKNQTASAVWWRRGTARCVSLNVFGATGGASDPFFIIISPHKREWLIFGLGILENQATRSMTGRHFLCFDVSVSFEIQKEIYLSFRGPLQPP